MKRPIPLHPFFFTLYPLFFLYAQNLGQVTFSQMVRSLVVFLTLTALVQLGLWRLLRDGRRAGLLVWLAAVLFFSFGHLASALKVPLPALGAAWIALLIGLGGLILFKLRSASTLTRLLNIVSGFLLGLALAVVLIFHLNDRGAFPQDAMRRPIPVQVKPELQQLPQSAPAQGQSRPDIYYIILDAYGQSKMIQDLYGLDNQPFLDFLQSRGFVVAEDSHSNYPQTLLSLTSSLNFAYLDQLATLDPWMYSRQPMIDFIQNSRALRFLRGQGYQIVALETGYEYTDLTSADVFIRAPFNLNQYEQNLLVSTAVMPWYRKIRVAAYRQDRVQHFQRVPELVSIPGPKFVFAHLVLPHPPFMFDRNGAPQPLEDISIGDGTHYAPGRADYLKRYPEQLLYTNTLVETMLTKILDSSPTPPVIILQGDHGPGALLDWGSLERTCLRERLSILNAYYLPGDKARAAIYPSITPVNSLRVIFDAYLGTSLGRLEDRSYFAIWDRPYALTDVTDRLDSCAPLGQ